MVNKNKIIQGDSLQVLKTLPDESVDCVITSPPYWALRDYGVAGQLGLEPTFQEYISKLCDIFDEVKRVLKKEGTCWVNLGDTYGTQSGAMRDGKFGPKNTNNFVQPKSIHKCLLQIPSHFAIEMCRRGWILRNEIIWHKPNCMPSSVTDRFTVDFEKVFFFVKSKKYWFEQQHEPHKTEENRPSGVVRNREYGYIGKYRVDNNFNLHNSRAGETQFLRKGIRLTQNGTVPHYNAGKFGRNMRSVWTINTKPLTDAHFATFPEALIEPMIKAGCPVGGTVLDIFMGAGTTAVVAKKNNRNYLGIELNPDYIKIAETRIGALTNPLF